MDGHQQQERERLRELYRAMSDEELELIARGESELTEDAREILRNELNRRQLEVDFDTDVGAAPGWEELVVVKQFRDLPEALLAKGSLESAGIECFLGDDNMIRMDWFISNLVGGAKLCVRPEDADAAVELLEQPVPEDFDVEGVGRYEQPTCPHCHSVDISYEGLNKPVAYTSAWIGVPIPIPRKRWKCASCGSTWKDTEDAASG